jgi:alkylated DNA repair dioxygenase AlkB
MSLFNITDQNLLPIDGEVYYFGQIFDETESRKIYQSLLTNIEWQHDTALIYGKHIVTKRKVAWIGDSEFHYNYSNTQRIATPWTLELLEIKSKVEKLVNYKYNSCLLNLYHDGSEGMGWHSDDEKGLGANPNIASVSFGATRRFELRHKVTKQKVSIDLEPGGLLLMKGATQRMWQHQLPKSTKVKKPRINLTFRQFGF